MRKLLKSGSMERDLQDAAEDLKLAVGELSGLSTLLVDGGNEQASRLIAKLIPSLQENESMLRKHADSLRTGRLGRRSDD